MLRECEAHVLSATQLVPLKDNDALRCLTWCFTLCPETIQDAIVDALEADLDDRSHPLLGFAPGRRTVLTEGAGRAVTGPGRLKRLLRVLVARPQNANTLNALAMVMSRRKEAPYALTEDMVGAIAMQLADELLAIDARALGFRFDFATRFPHWLACSAIEKSTATHCWRSVIRLPSNYLIVLRRLSVC